MTSHPRPNRATHAEPRPEGSRGLLLMAQAAEQTRCAIHTYRAYVADPIFSSPPTLAQVWLIAEYCQEYINSPRFVVPAEELRELRKRVECIRTLRDLADWLWDCRRIGIEPL